MSQLQQSAETGPEITRVDPRGRYDDPLLDSLLSLCACHQKPASRTTLTAGLPLANQRLTPELLPRAAAGAGCAVNLVKSLRSSCPPCCSWAMAAAHC